ncbi:DUF7521 family protein [Halostella salina]|uniref:DUF7521 family protein n=1 Tax=Halostella salina TaxID=1547897 RepID=UPI000EF800AA|nr:hypothetical protein [Halostella salina]
MNTDIPPIVIAFKVVTLVIGGLITYIAAIAARTSPWSGLSHLAVGFGIVTLGSLLGGIADRFLFLDTASALVVEHGLTVVGFAVIGYSLYLTSKTSGRTP